MENTFTREYARFEAVSPIAIALAKPSANSAKNRPSKSTIAALQAYEKNCEGLASRVESSIHSLAEWKQRMKEAAQRYKTRAKNLIQRLNEKCMS